MQIGSILSYKTTEVLELNESSDQSYSNITTKFGLSCAAEDYYLFVGNLRQIQGWILHLSTIAKQIPSLLKVVLPILKKEAVPFKLVANQSIAKSVLGGGFGYTKIGKIISIYPESEQQALKLANELISKTAELRGPRVLTDRHLGNIVYTRYGAHKGIQSIGEKGDLKSYIYDHKLF